MTFSIIKDLGTWPFAHRQAKHPGHCALIHGHNWRIRVHLSGPLDEQGFVYDFGHFKVVREHFRQLFDHTLVLAKDDPMLHELREALAGLAKIVVLPGASAEQIAEYIGTEILPAYIPAQLIAAVEVWEDENDIAIWRP